MNHRFTSQGVLILAAIGLLALLTVGQALAQDRGSAEPTEASVPLGPAAPLGTAFTYQGQLRDNNGNAINSTCDFRFTLYDALTAGAQAGAPLTKTGIAVDKGYFTVLLDFGAGIFTGQARWMEVAVKCSGDAAFITLGPRQALTAAPYALEADLLDGQQGSAFASAGHNHWGQTWSGSGSGLRLIGATTAISVTGSTYGVYGAATTTDGTAGYFSNTTGSGTSRGWGVRAFTGSGDPVDVHWNTRFYNAAGEFAGPNGLIGAASSDAGDGYGVIGISGNWTGVGVYGMATATDGYNYGVYGDSTAPNSHGVYGINRAIIGNGSGVYGISNSTNGYGVHGYNQATTGATYGVYGQSRSPNGYGVYGINQATASGYGVYGLSYASDGYGVYAENEASTGNAYGVYGISSSTSGIGVNGRNSMTTGSTYGVRGQASSPDGYGVYGINGATTGGYGVYGISLSSGGYGVKGINTASAGTTYGVYGQTSSTNGYAVYGDSTATTGTTYGVFGHIFSTAGAGLYGIAEINGAYTTAGVRGRSDADNGFGVAGHAFYAGVGVGAWSYSGDLIRAYSGDYPGGTLRFRVDNSGNVYADGIYTSPASSLDGTTRALTYIQSTEIWLEDYGHASLVDGIAVVEIAPDFAGLANLSAEYLVFITLEGDCPGAYITDKTPASFSVRAVNAGKCNTDFSYRIVAKQPGSETVRLPEVKIPTPVEVTRQPDEPPQLPEQPQTPAESGSESQEGQP